MGDRRARLGTLAPPESTADSEHNKDGTLRSGLRIRLGTQAPPSYLTALVAPQGIDSC